MQWPTLIGVRLFFYCAAQWFAGTIDQNTSSKKMRRLAAFMTMKQNAQSDGESTGAPPAKKAKSERPDLSEEDYSRIWELYKNLCESVRSGRLTMELDTDGLSVRALARGSGVDNTYHATVALLVDRSESSVRRVVEAKGIKPKVQRGGSKPLKEWSLEELAELRLKLLKRLAKHKRCVLSFSKQIDNA